MDEVAEMAELSKGTLYLYFKNKEELHREVAFKTSKNLTDMAVKRNEKARDAVEKLVTLGRVLIDYTRSNPGYLKIILFQKPSDFERLNINREEIKQAIYTESPIRLVLDYVKEGIDQHLIRSDINPFIIANTLWSQFLGVLELAFDNKGLLELVEMDSNVLFENHFELVLNGIKK